MLRLFVSLYRLWTGKESAPEWVLPFWIAIVSFCTATTLTILTPRSVLGEGFRPGAGWIIWLAIGCIAAMSVPVGEIRLGSPWPWRLLPLVLVFALNATVGVVIGIVLAAATGLSSWVKGKAGQAAGSNLFVFSLMWLGALFANNAYAYLDGRIHDAPLLSWPLAFMLRLFGHESVIQNGAVTYQSESGVQVVMPSLDKLGGEFVPTFVAATLAAAILFGFPLRRLLLCLATSIGFSFVWCAMAVLYFGSTGFTDWWDDGFVILTYLPFAPLAALALGFKRAGEKPAQIAKPLLRAGSFAAGLVGCSLLIAGWFWPYPGPIKDGVVLLDESKSDWEWTTEPIGTQWFGTRSVYNYSEFYKGLGHYFDIERNTKEITPATLKGVSVLILKTPTRPYSETSIDAIEQYVRQGGSVWLVGDHTDAFGMSTYLNKVAQRFGFLYRDDAFTEPREIRTVFNPGAYAHPASRDMNTFLFYTGCSVLGGWTASDTVVAGRMLMDDADRVAGTFFGDFKAQLSERVGFSRGAVATTIDRGRLAIWADSTLFSNFSIHFPGKLETAVATIDWLRRGNSAVDWRLVLIGGGALLVLLSAFLGFTTFASTPWWALALSVPIVAGTRDWSYPAVPEQMPFRRTAFLDEELSFHFPMLWPHDQPISEGYLTAFIAVQRVQRRPWLVSDLDQAMKAPTIVIVHAHVPLSREDETKLIEWVRRGGRLILLDTGAVIDPIARVLRAANIYSKPVQHHKGAMPEAEMTAVWMKGKTTDHELGKHPYAATLSGACLPYVKTEHGAIVVAGGRIGQGEVVVSTTVNLFSDLTLGENATIPNDKQLVAYHLLFDWFGRDNERQMASLGP